MKSRLTGAGAADGPASGRDPSRRASPSATLPAVDAQRLGPESAVLAPWLSAIGPSPIALTPQNTTVLFHVRWLGGLVVRGAFRELEGAVQIPRDDPAAVSVNVEIAAESVRTGISLRDRHLRGPLFLDVAYHPVIRFRGGNVMRWATHLTMPGSLTVRGLVHTQELDCHVESPLPLDGQLILRLGATTTVNRRAFTVGTPHGIRRLDPLFVVIGDDVHIAIEVDLPVRRP